MMGKDENNQDTEYHTRSDRLQKPEYNMDRGVNTVADVWLERHINRAVRKANHILFSVRSTSTHTDRSRLYCIYDGVSTLGRRLTSPT